MFLSLRYITCILLFTISLAACKEEPVEYSNNVCKANSPFIASFGFKPAYSYFSTADMHTMGLVLFESAQQGSASSTDKKMQHPSWRAGGWLAPILIAANGDIFTAPAPFINIYNNPISNNNTIYKVDGQTGVMAVYYKLPDAEAINTENPFGIIGMTLLCETNTLYVSSLAGSSRHQQKGHIYAIDLATATVIDQLTDIDATGMGITYITGQRKLYFGTGRSSNIMEITLDKKGKFSGKPAVAFSLEGLGTGNEKVRKLRPDERGNLVINAMEFDYNLVPQREKQEMVYHFNWDEEQKKWTNIK